MKANLAGVNLLYFNFTLLGVRITIIELGQLYFIFTKLINCTGCRALSPVAPSNGSSISVDATPPGDFAVRYDYSAVLTYPVSARATFLTCFILLSFFFLFSRMQAVFLRPVSAVKRGVG